MAVELTETQQQALDAHKGQPLHLVDPRTQRDYVLMPADVLDQIEDLLEEAEDQKLRQAWLELATKTRRQWVSENPY